MHITFKLETQRLHVLVEASVCVHGIYMCLYVYVNTYILI